MKVAFVLTTHHEAYETAAEAMVHLLHVLKDLPLIPHVYLFLNEPSSKTLVLKKTYEHHPWIEVEVVEDQSGGLTYTWNAGILKGMAAGCDVFLLLNDDVRVNPSLLDLILAAANPENLAICGPGTSPSGAPYNPESWVYYKRRTLQPHMIREEMDQWHGLNGFCLAFHRHLLQANTFDGLHCFDPKIPFGGNETEFGKRWYLQGGKCALVYSCYVDHHKHSAWRSLAAKHTTVKVQRPPSMVASSSFVTRKPSILLLSFTTLQDYPSLPLIKTGEEDTTHIALVAGMVKGRTVPSTHRGWTLVPQRNRAWNSRLRLKHLLGYLSGLASLDFSLILLESPLALPLDPSFLLSAVLPSSFGSGGSAPMGALPAHPSHPSLQSFLDAKAEINGPMMTPFQTAHHRESGTPKMTPFQSEKDSGGTPKKAFSLYPSLWRLSKETLELFGLWLEMGSKVDWDFDFIISWSASSTGLDLVELDPLWVYRLTSGK